ncbi:hypothetical protein BT69DRAFT_27832 [Atractiella rhizophila]|nr:hypothetical protein BT69DRAFT_27832 [Atractiella rhizophila]
MGSFSCPAHLPASPCAILEHVKGGFPLSTFPQPVAVEYLAVNTLSPCPPSLKVFTLSSEQIASFSVSENPHFGNLHFEVSLVICPIHVLLENDQLL